MVYVSDTMIKFKDWSRFHNNRPSTVRSNITQFSEKSRQRFYELLLLIDFDINNSSFLTLTIHREIYISSPVLKKILKYFRTSFFRYFGKMGFVWKLEFNESGQVHYHAITSKKILGFQLLRDIWADSVCRFTSYDYYDLMIKASCRSEKIRGKGISWYISKYISKSENSKVPENFHSRFWGIWNKQFFKWKQVENYDISRFDFYSGVNKINQIIKCKYILKKMYQNDDNNIDDIKNLIDINYIDPYIKLSNKIKEFLNDSKI